MITTDSSHTVEKTPPVDCWAILRVGGERLTKVSVSADETVRLELRERDL